MSRTMMLRAALVLLAVLVGALLPEAGAEADASQKESGKMSLVDFLNQMLTEQTK